jgi:hypothetical protein
VCTGAGRGRRRRGARARPRRSERAGAAGARRPPASASRASSGPRTTSGALLQAVADPSWARRANERASADARQDRATYSDVAESPRRGSARIRPRSISRNALLIGFTSRVSISGAAPAGRARGRASGGRRSCGRSRTRDFCRALREGQIHGGFGPLCRRGSMVSTGMLAHSRVAGKRSAPDRPARTRRPLRDPPFVSSGPYRRHRPDPSTRLGSASSRSRSRRSPRRPKPTRPASDGSLHVHLRGWERSNRPGRLTRCSSSLAGHSRSTTQEWPARATLLLGGPAPRRRTASEKLIGGPRDDREARRTRRPCARSSRDDPFVSGGVLKIVRSCTMMVGVGGWMPRTGQEAAAPSSSRRGLRPARARSPRRARDPRACAGARPRRNARCGRQPCRRTASRLSGPRLRASRPANAAERLGLADVEVHDPVESPGRNPRVQEEVALQEQHGVDRHVDAPALAARPDTGSPASRAARSRA